MIFNPTLVNNKGVIKPVHTNIKEGNSYYDLYKVQGNKHYLIVSDNFVDSIIDAVFILSESDTNGIDLTDNKEIYFIDEDGFIKINKNSLLETYCFCLEDTY